MAVLPQATLRAVSAEYVSLQAAHNVTYPEVGSPRSTCINLRLKIAACMVGFVCVITAGAASSMRGAALHGILLLWARKSASHCKAAGTGVEQHSVSAQLRASACVRVVQLKLPCCTMKPAGTLQSYAAFNLSMPDDA